MTFRPDRPLDSVRADCSDCKWSPESEGDRMHECRRAFTHARDEGHHTRVVTVIIDLYDPDGRSIRPDVRELDL